MKRKKLDFTFDPGTAFSVGCRPTVKNTAAKGIRRAGAVPAETSVFEQTPSEYAAVTWSLEVQTTSFGKLS
jgi:hypothetical protein